MPSLHALLHQPRWRIHWRLLLAALVLVVACFAFVPRDGSEPGLDGVDKLEHLLAFGTLGASAMCALPAGLRAALAAATALLAYGGFIELVQTHIPGRTASWADLLADAAGVAIGVALVAVLRRRWPARH